MSGRSTTMCTEWPTRSARQPIKPNGVEVQAAGAPPVRQMVRVAVLPPRLPENMAPPTGLGAADVMSWDESINWSHNQRIEQESEVSATKKFTRKIGLTTQRKKRNEDLPPFVFREIPYAIWRKHYAKDKDGRYHGTHAPAEDCLLLPEDVQRWRLEDPVTKADQWTRGKHVLPSYAEVQNDPSVPEYSEAAEQSRSSTDRRPSMHATVSDPDTVRLSTFAVQCEWAEGSCYRLEGRTTEEIINEAKEKRRLEKEKKKGRWRESLRRGTTTALLGTNLG